MTQWPIRWNENDKSQRAYILFCDFKKKEVLLGFDYENKWTGLGGRRMRTDDTIEKTAVREVLEELFHWQTIEKKEEFSFEDNLKKWEGKRKYQELLKRQPYSCPTIYESEPKTNDRKRYLDSVIRNKRPKTYDATYIIDLSLKILNLKNPYSSKEYPKMYTFFVDIKKLNKLLKVLQNYFWNKREEQTSTLFYETFPTNIDELIHCRENLSTIKQLQNYEILFLRLLSIHTISNIEEYLQKDIDMAFNLPKQSSKGRSKRRSKGRIILSGHPIFFNRSNRSRSSRSRSSRSRSSRSRSSRSRS